MLTVKLYSKEGRAIWRDDFKVINDCQQVKTDLSEDFTLAIPYINKHAFYINI